MRVVKSNRSNIFQIFWAYLEVEVEDVGDVDVAGREAHVLAQEVGQGKVSVGSVTFGQENRIVETKIFSAGHFLVFKK